MRAAILTLSDKGSRGERVDTSGPALRDWLYARQVEVTRTHLIADDIDAIEMTLVAWSDSGDFDLILTTGGTGVSPRDVTPDATLRVVERVLPGFGEAMRAMSFQKTANALLSRAIAGIRGRTLIINLPGSPRGAVENLEAIWPTVPHAVRKIQGDESDCTRASRAGL